MLYRSANESTGSVRRFRTLSAAQAYRDERDYDEYVVIYGIYTGDLIAETACRSVFRYSLPKVPTVSTEELRNVLENVQITDSFGFGGEVVLDSHRAGTARAHNQHVGIAPLGML